MNNFIHSTAEHIPFSKIINRLIFPLFCVFLLFLILGLSACKDTLNKNNAASYNHNFITSSNIVDINRKAEKGASKEQLELGLFYSCLQPDRIAICDVNQAEKWLVKAANQSNTEESTHAIETLIQISLLYQGSIKNAKYWLDRLNKQDHIAAERLYLELGGMDSIPPDTYGFRNIEDYLKSASDVDDINSLIRLAEIYSSVKEDKETAKKLIEKASKQNSDNPETIERFIKIYNRGWFGVEKDLNKAKSYMKKLKSIKHYSSEEAYNVFAKEKNYAELYQWSKLAKDHDISWKKLYIEMNLLGLGTKINSDHVIQITQKALNQGKILSSALHHKDLLNRKNCTNIINKLRSNASNGSKNDQYAFAELITSKQIPYACYNNELLNEGIQILEEIALSGHKYAAYKLYSFYNSDNRSNDYVSREIRKTYADKWLQKAAELQHPYAQLKYGEQQARIAKQSPASTRSYHMKNALEWFEKAAKNGNAEAHMYIAAAYYEGEIKNKNLNKAQEYFSKGKAIALEQIENKVLSEILKIDGKIDFVTISDKERYIICALTSCKQKKLESIKDKMSKEEKILAEQEILKIKEKNRTSL